MRNLKCKLCSKNSADNKNSHILSKFLGKRLFESSKGRHSIQIGRNGKNRMIYDTPKQDYLFCKKCEKRMEILETLFAKYLRNIHRHNELSTKFELRELQGLKYLICLEIHPIAFKLFIYLLVWRTSISSVEHFRKFKIPSSDEEILRKFLNENLKSTHKELVNSFDFIDKIPGYHNCFVKPIEMSDQSRGFYTAYNMAESTHLLLLVDFAIIFISDDNNIDIAYETFSNKQSDKVIVYLSNINSWNSLNQKIFSTLWDRNGT